MYAVSYGTIGCLKNNFAKCWSLSINQLINQITHFVIENYLLAVKMIHMMGIMKVAILYGTKILNFTVLRLLAEP